MGEFELKAAEACVAQARKNCELAEKHLADLRAKPKTVGETVANNLVFHNMWSNKNWGISCEDGARYFAMRVDPSDVPADDAAECRRVIAAAVDKAVADEREANLFLVEGAKYYGSTSGFNHHTLISRQDVAAAIRARK